MTDKSSYTPDEVAKILKISKYTVYELIKRGELAAYRIGRKFRIERPDLEAYIQSKKSQASAPASNMSTSVETAISEIPSPAAYPHPSEELIICGQDIILDVLTRHLVKYRPTLRVLRNYIGSIDGLTALYRGQANVATVHLWDSDSDDYNLPFVRRLMPGHQATVINLVYRLQGFYVAAGNPKNIKTWQDLVRPDIRFVNRELGSGTRVLLDEKLRLLRIPHHLINGYYEEEMSHIAVASKVARGEADVGLGNEKAATQVAGLDFIPLQRERYDLVIRQEDLPKAPFKALVEVINSESYRQEVEGMGGYDVSQMGNIIED
ncbi:MAG: helix-turn-helix transcriptional regulator [Peptococcaceae bacterium]|nr:helix-turn-helix transcriptional regulator [Peptococcaceae bacterium]